MNVVDLRSDTVTRPTPAMRAAMAAAPVGDDVFGDDPSVNALQERIAAMLGKEAALFVASGTQSNLVAILSHCGRGDEYIVGQMAHTYRWEGGGGAALGGVQPQPLEHEADGSLSLAGIAAAVKPDDDHFAKSRLLCLENTIGGKALPVAYLEAATAVARQHDLVTHLDGARLFNAAVKLGVPAAEIGASFDSVSVCFSKGLGAPIGSALVLTTDIGELPSANLDLARLPTPPSSEAPTQQTISFKAEVPPILRSLGSLERQAEQKRIAARKKRQDKERLATADTTASPATPAAPGTPGTPGAAGAAAGAAQEVKMTKKEREKQAKQLHQTEEIIRQQANNAAAMALGGKSRYSWMTSASTPAAGSGFGTGVGAGRSTPVSRTTSVVGVPQVQKEEDRGLRSRDDWKTLGDFREDGPGGKGVQLRDVVTVLERDGGIESRSLTKAYTQMRSEKQEKK